LPEISGPEVSELEADILEIDDTTMLVNDLSMNTNPVAQQLAQDVEEYICMIDQSIATEDGLTDEGIVEMVKAEFQDNNETDDDEPPLLPPVTITEAIEALKKVIRYQESLEMGKGFDEKGLMMLRKKLREWGYEKEEAKKQVSLMSFIKK